MQTKIFYNFNLLKYFISNIHNKIQILYSSTTVRTVLYNRQVLLI